MGDGQGNESDDDDDVMSSYEDSQLEDPMLDSLRYEPLKPPPEIEAELQRAKLQLQRPAMLATAHMYDPKWSERSESNGMYQQPNFVAVDRNRVSFAAQKKASSTPPSVHLRARYVDTFNSP